MTMIHCNSNMKDLREAMIVVHSGARTAWRKHSVGRLYNDLYRSEPAWFSEEGLPHLIEELGDKPTLVVMGWNRACSLVVFPEYIEEGDATEAKKPMPLKVHMANEDRYVAGHFADLLLPGGGKVPMLATPYFSHGTLGDDAFITSTQDLGQLTNENTLWFRA